MKSTFYCIGLVMVSLVSCKKEEELAPKTSDNVSVFSDSFSGPIDTAAVKTPTPSSVATTSPTAVTPTMVQPTTAKGMNPAHGQPGHRCDIAVGAPLNSPPGKVNAKKPETNTKVTTISSNGQPGVVTSNGATITTTNNNPGAATVSPIVTPEGMNPPHGQEGHDCAVAVGAPLPKK